jgi:L-alanine-DL-glutamate epimerase-like enolase superfamily enzyme
LPEPSNGWLTLPEKPGLGFAPNAERVRELAKLPLSSGKGKA